MKMQRGFLICAFGALTLPVMAQEFDRHAEIRGNYRERGRCEVTVVVDGSAEIQIRRAEGRLTDLSGAPAIWRHFECSAEMPRDPMEFNFRMISGRGRAQLLQPAQGGRPAVIRIEDPQGGAGEYRFEMYWRGVGGGFGGDRPVERAWAGEDAIRSCRDAVIRQAQDRFRTDRVEIRRIDVDSAPGRREWVVGTLEVRRDRDRFEPFRFSCSADFGGRRIRSVDITPLDRNYRR